ncbi:MAG: AbrB/MazE/SpoVT family DNA-binding domain-containing protein [Natronomonas sp.]
MTDETDGAAWPPNALKAFQQVSEQATQQQQEALKQLFAGGAGASDLAPGVDTDGLDAQLDAVSRTATFKTRVQSGGRISIPDAEREALDIEEGDIVQTVVVPVKRNREDGD